MAISTNNSRLNASPNSLNFIITWKELGIKKSENVRKICSILNQDSLISPDKFMKYCRFIDPTLNCLKCVDMHGASLLCEAAERGNTAVIRKIISESGKALLNMGGFGSWTPLFNATLNDRYSTVLELIALGAEINCFRIVGEEPGVSCYSVLRAAANGSNVAIVKLFLRHGARSDFFDVGRSVYYPNENFQRAQENLQKAKKMLVEEDINCKLLLKGRFDSNSFLNKVPTEIFFEIMNFLVWS